MYKYPTWRSNDRKSWVSKKAMDNFSGVNAHHVKIGYPGQGVTEVH